MSEAEATFALCLLASGDGGGAERAASRAVKAAKGHPLVQARARVQRAVVRQRAATGRWLEDYEEAIPVLVRTGDDHWEALARLNRGAGLTYLGRLVEARADLARCAELQEAAGRAHQSGFARHNLGYAASRAGDFPSALRAYEMAAATLERAGVDQSPGVLDHAETLLAAGLTADSIRILTAHLPQLASSLPTLAAEARLLLARAWAAEADPHHAAEEAAIAAREFGTQGRPGWALVADVVAETSAIVGGFGNPERALELAAASVSTWPDESTELAAATAAAIASERLDLAERALAIPPLGGSTSMASRLMLARAHMAVALITDGREALLNRAEQALDELNQQRALLGASELRAHVSRYAVQMLSAAAYTALELGDLDQAVAWVDRVRSQALDHPPVVPPDDVELADALGRLRVVAYDITRGRADGEDVSGLEDERAELERRVRDRSRTARGHGITEVEAGTRAPGTIEVAWMNLGPHLVALVADDTGTRRVDLEAGTDTIDAELDALGFAMQRVGRSRVPGRRRDLAARSLDHSLATLDEALVAPLELPDDGAVVVSPTSVLFDVPWSGLPSLVDRAVTVGPSLRLARRPARQDVGSGTLLLEGPRLAHARAELDALAGVVADPYPVLGEQATVAAAREALPEAAIAHLACHGVFRADNPQFSSLELADGPMFVYDLETLPRVPELLVLSACQTGRSAVHAGDELLGVTASLLAMGARHVVAALADVPDDLSAVLMLAFHEAVATGASPAAALARARSALLATHDEPAARLTAAAFACIGAP